MPRRSELLISKRTVDGLSVQGKDAVFRDRELPGFGVRVYPSGRKIYVVQSRGPRGLRRVSLGRHGELAAEQTRKQAATVIDRIKSGENPAPTPAGLSLTVADLAARYMEAQVAVSCNAHTRGIYRRALDNHILPALGTMAFGAVGRAEIAALHYALRDTPRAANRALMVLSNNFSLAEAWDLVPTGSNPCRFVPRYRTRRPERFLTEEEFRRLGEALDALQLEGRLRVHAAAALKLLMLTGCRSSEITSRRWEDVHLHASELRLRDSKTGPRVIPISPPAVRVLEGLPRIAGNPWVIVGRKPGTHLSHIGREWYRVRGRAGLDDVRIHDLRHSFASRALALGESLSMIGTLLGHSKIQTTARYAHLARDSIRESAARVAASIGADLRSAPGAG